MNVQLYPLYFLPSANGSAPPPADPQLFEALQKFCEAEFGERKRFDQDVKTWVAAEHTDEGYVVHGITSLRLALECHTFHIKPMIAENTASGVKEAWRGAEMVRDLMIWRASAFIHDKYGIGTNILLRVEAKAERFWRKFLARIGARSAGVWDLKV